MEYFSPSHLEKISDRNQSAEYLRRTFSNEQGEDSFVSEETKELIRDAVTNLNDEQKTIIHLRFWESLAIEEIAYTIKKKESHVLDQLDSALAKLKSFLMSAVNKHNKEQEDNYS